MTAIRRRLRLDSVGFLLGVTALAVYLPGIWWGLPYASHTLGTHGWDVDAVTGLQTLSELHNLLAQTKPDWWVAYPLFHYLVIGFSYAPYLGYLWLTGGLSSLSTEFPYGLTDPVSTMAGLALIGRMVTVLMASGIIVAAYLTAKTVWDRRTGVLAAITMLLATPMFYYARTGTLDVPVLFWTSLGLLVIARCLAKGFTVRRGVWLGALIALSVATKDQSFGAWLSGLVALAIIYYRQPEPSPANSPSLRWKVPLAVLLSGVTVYAIASGLILSPRRFFAHLWFLTHFKETFPNVVQANILRPASPTGFLLLTSDVLQAVVLAIGPVLLLIGLVGLLGTWRSTLFSRLLAAMVLGHVLLVIFPIRHMQYRYSMILALILAFLAARAMAVGMTGKPTARLLSLAVLVTGFGWLGARGTDLTYQMLFDARNEAGSWLASQGQAGDQIAYFGPTPNTVPALPRGMSSRGLPDDASAMEILKQERVRYVLAVPGYFTDVGLEKNPFLPQAVAASLEEGTLGYRRMAVFQTRPLFGGPLMDFPLASLGYLVNPTVQIFGLDEGVSMRSERE